MATTPSYILRLTRAAFRQEAEELLADFDTCLLQLEGTPTDRSLMDRAFRVIHTLKGSGATAGFQEVSHILHDVENVFNSAREGRITVTSEVVDRVLPITDLVKRMLLASETDMPSLLEEGKRLLAAMTNPWSGADSPPDRREGPGAPEAERPRSAVWKVHFRPEPGFFKTGNDPLVYLKELYAQGPSRVKVSSSLDGVTDFDPEDCYLAWEIQVASDTPEQVLRDIFAFVEDVAEIRIELVDSRTAWSLPGDAYFDAALLTTFLEECAEHISEVEGLILALEDGRDQAARITELRRHLHNLKGVSRLVLSDAKRVPPPSHPLRALGDLCHAAEDAINRIGSVESAAGRVEPLFDLVDWMRTLSHAVVSGEDDPWPTDLLAELRDRPSPVAPSLPASALSPSALPPSALSPSALSPSALSPSALPPSALSPSALPQRTTSATAPLDLEAAVCQHGRTISLRPARPSSRLGRMDAAEVAGVKATSAGATENLQPRTPIIEQRRSIRVDQGKLDRLMQAISELLVAKNALPLLAQKAESQETAPVARDIKELGLRIGHIADDLQDAMRQVRMLPIRTVFQKFPRMIRDLSHSLGKHVQLIMSGEEVELDKTVLEQIGDPLVHLLRNAVDHGIESPEDRVRRGKSDTGTIGLEVATEGTHVVIRVSDDGRGMHPARLRERAQEKGLVAHGVAEALSDQEALDLIFLPGFSTAKTVTEVSGRGVGMDVVGNSVRTLGGTIGISSELGSGSVFTIRLPSSVMVSKGVLIEAGGEQYVLPFEGVQEMVKITPSQVRMIRKRAWAVLRGAVCRVVSLADLLRRRDDEADPWAFIEASAVVVASARGTSAVIVERLIAEVDVIAKPLAEGYDRRHLFRGATILGNGRVALVLEPASLERLIFDDAGRDAIDEPAEKSESVRSRRQQADGHVFGPAVCRSDGSAASQARRY